MWTLCGARVVSCYGSLGLAGVHREGSAGLFPSYAIPASLASDGLVYDDRIGHVAIVVHQH